MLQRLPIVFVIVSLVIMNGLLILYNILLTLLSVIIPILLLLIVQEKAKNKKTQTTPTQTPQAGSIPVILIQTKSERGTIDAAKNLSKEKTYPLVEVSALEGTNIEQCFKVISEAVISSSSSKKQVQQPQPQVKEETPSIPETKTEIPVSNKVKENNIWSKLMTKFLGKLQDKAEKVETLETENLESTAPVA